MQKDPSADRFASTKKVVEAVGGKMISYEWVRGRFDVMCCRNESSFFKFRTYG